MQEDGSLDRVRPGGALANDSDTEGRTLTAQIVTHPAHGQLGFAPDGGFGYFKFDMNFNGQDSFTYQVSDGIRLSAVATVTITVNPVNDAPNLQFIGSKTVAEGVRLNFTVTATDPEGDAVTYEISGEPPGQPWIRQPGSSAGCRAARRR
jgi:VCBS repeat-containing protein